MIFFIWTDPEENLNKFLEDLRGSLDLVIKLTDRKIVTDFVASLWIVTSICVMIRAKLNTSKDQ